MTTLSGMKRIHRTTGQFPEQLHERVRASFTIDSVMMKAWHCGISSPSFVFVVSCDIAQHLSGGERLLHIRFPWRMPPHFLSAGGVAGPSFAPMDFFFLWRRIFYVIGPSARLWTSLGPLWLCRRVPYSPHLPCRAPCSPLLPRHVPRSPFLDPVGTVKTDWRVEGAVLSGLSPDFGHVLFVDVPYSRVFPALVSSSPPLHTCPSCV
ncbi:uncharacterized protein LOC132862254 [Tachysurus vachellii]|uniref:uncharacterized protein LOC132862254 n=1 Tax=Tachysurus vachellii TaxID=175792 RepID=UPI00296B15AC|nr:uncharacterized protein LOC132862254 [Tachysurus vachellii]